MRKGLCKAQAGSWKVKLVHLFSHVAVNRDIRALASSCGKSFRKCQWRCGELLPVFQQHTHTHTRHGCTHPSHPSAQILHTPTHAHTHPLTHQKGTRLIRRCGCFPLLSSLHAHNTHSFPSYRSKVGSKGGTWRCLSGVVAAE